MRLDFDVEVPVAVWVDDKGPPNKVRGDAHSAAVLGCPDLPCDREEAAQVLASASASTQPKLKPLPADMCGVKLGCKKCRDKPSGCTRCRQKAGLVELEHGWEWPLPNRRVVGKRPAAHV